ncbi:hypothetical protein Clacol_010376 [Clathrus columnatus]|uniref:Uncharacterized protein n=1 Tax=Clathrus columnatus TaxID=1419009 RepID=A0AAV5AN38_9AGAM|nr:hypothetical protein Clacol_010376 [Clathrus columnatus]
MPGRSSPPFHVITSASVLANGVVSLLVEQLTAVNDLQNLDRPRPYRKVRGTAVVCGGSISGLLAAKACAAHFESVIVIEAEGWLSDSTATNLDKSYRDADFPHKRSHVAQYYATHFFLSFLIKAMLKWFPNFSSEVKKKGGKIVPQVFTTYISGIPLVLPKFASEEKVPRTVAITRPTFETILRKLVLESCPNLTYICGSVIGLVKDSTADDIRGVRIRKSTGETIVPASLVLDCTGSAMGGFRWLKELAIAEGRNISALRLDSLRSTYSPKLRYATFEFNVPLHLRPRMKELGYPGNWETNFIDFLNQADPDIDFQYICGGWDRPKRNLTSIHDMKEFISQIGVWRPLPEWITLLLDLFEENKVPFTAKSNSLVSCTYIPYHLYEDLPSNFVVIGDSGMTTNPLRA